MKSQPAPSMHTVILVVIIAILAALVDFLWLGLIAKNFYAGQLGDMLRPAGIELDVRLLGALGVYLLIGLGVALFVLPKAEGHLPLVLLWGAILGLVVYGIYEFTNWALLEKWPIKVVFVDILWGAVFLALLSAVGHYIGQWIG